MPHRAAPVLVASCETLIGRHWLAGSVEGLVEIALSDGPEPLLESLYRRRREWVMDDAALAAARGQLVAFHAGARREFTVVLDLRGVPAFDAAAYRAAMRIPYGETASYGEVAVMAGSPRAARAVGGAMARCPLFPIVPCHRVIHADGSITGWGPNLWVKRRLLEMERNMVEATHSAHTGAATAEPRR